MQEQETGPAKLRTEIELNQSPIIVNDLWQIEPSNIFIENGRIMIDNFTLITMISLFDWMEMFSKTPTDTLKLDLKRCRTQPYFRHSKYSGTTIRRKGDRDLLI